MYACKKILIPIDGSDGALLAAKYGMGLGQALGAEVILLHVIPKLDRHFYLLENENKEAAEQIIRKYSKHAEYIVDKVQNELSSYPVSPKAIILWGDPSFEICKMVEKGDYDLIVIGSRGLTEIKEYLLGSVSMRVVRRAKCPVLVVR